MHNVMQANRQPVHVTYLWLGNWAKLAATGWQNNVYFLTHYNIHRSLNKNIYMYQFKHNILAITMTEDIPAHWLSVLSAPESRSVPSWTSKLPLSLLTVDVAKLSLQSRLANRDVSYIFRRRSRPPRFSSTASKAFGFASKTLGFANKTFGFANKTFGFANKTFGFANKTFGFSNKTFGFANKTFGFPLILLLSH